MTLTSAACPLTDVIEDQAKSATDGIVNELRINWVWMPPWGPDKITDDGREQLRALGFNVWRILVHRCGPRAPYERRRYLPGAALSLSRAGALGSGRPATSRNASPPGTGSCTRNARGRADEVACGGGNSPGS